MPSLREQLPNGSNRNKVEFLADHIEQEAQTIAQQIHQGLSLFPVYPEHPSTPKFGQVYANSSDNHFYGFNGSRWVQLDNAQALRWAYWMKHSRFYMQNDLKIEVYRDDYVEFEFIAPKEGEVYSTSPQSSNVIFASGVPEVHVTNNEPMNGHNKWTFGITTEPPPNTILYQENECMLFLDGAPLNKGDVLPTDGARHTLKQVYLGLSHMPPESDWQPFGRTIAAGLNVHMLAIRLTRKGEVFTFSLSEPAQLIPEENSAFALEIIDLAQGPYVPEYWKQF
ncbi:hypothetical protein ACHELW_002625 [Vibrio vulnificus]